ncbi:MAG: helix-turn-helix domain-containing protein [Fusobacteriaceae bacterium]
MEELYTVKEVSKMLRTNPTYVYKLIKADLIDVLKLGSIKITKSSLDKFLEHSIGKDLSDPFDIKALK